MNILISSHAFAPSIGGLETVSALLAEEFAKLGDSVVVITQTADGPNLTQSAIPIVRAPSASRLRRLIRWCDVFWHNNLSLRTAWPALLLGKPLVVTHGGSYCRRPVGFDFALRIKHALANRVTGVAISRYVASFFEPAPVVIFNPYDAETFQTRVPPSARTHELLFLGRLVSEKGLDTLLEALVRLRQRQLRPRLTVVGSGPEQTSMQELTKTLGLEDQVHFRGAQSGPELASILNQHQILIVPSKYDEPFGVVALEGIACGCAVIGSNGGGLPEAIGPGGITFSNGDSGALENALEQLLMRPDERERLIAAGPRHLAQFQPRFVAQRYRDLFETLSL